MDKQEEWDREFRDVMKVTKSSFTTYKVPRKYRKLILEAFYSREWDVLMDCDGCTFVKEKWVNRYFPPCVWHDYEMKRFKEGKSELSRVSLNLIFKDMLEIYQQRKVTTILWFLGVSISYKLFGR